jgi:GT2 family glycosyltransferase
MANPLATIVVVPRERFGVTQRSLEAIYANTAGPFQLVYVDGGSPARIRRYLAAEARARGFTLVRTDRYLIPNEARNLGMRHVRTPYVVFIDNDVVPAPSWLDRLVECAEATDAWIVGPMYFIGEPEYEEVHMAAGDAHIEEGPTGRRFVESHRFAGKCLADIRTRLVRMPCELAEFHCMLVRAEVFDRLGPLDEALQSIAEHSDLCMLVRREGGKVYFEPDSIVTYITSGRFGWADYPFYLWRWADARNEASAKRLCEKWDLAADDSGNVAHERWAMGHRHVPFKPTLRKLERLLGWRWGRWLGQDVLLGLERRINRWWVPPPPRPPRASAPPDPVGVGR